MMNKTYLLGDIVYKTVLVNPTEYRIYKLLICGIYINEDGQRFYNVREANDKKYNYYNDVSDFESGIEFKTLKEAINTIEQLEGEIE